jgi:RecJ-like exonuclease
MSSLYSKADWDALQSKPCTCVSCGDCNGTGNVWRNYDALGRYVEGGIDDSSDLETCDTCRGSGIVETCDRCQLLQEMDEQEQEYSYRQERNGLP